MNDDALNAGADNNAPGERHDDDSLMMMLQRWYREDVIVADKWKKQAREDYAFYNGDQWNEDDLAVLKEQRRPVMTFNRIAPLVNAVIGSEVNNRREVRYIPREVGDSQANEILTGAGDWFRDQSDAESEDSQAFSDTVVCGMGWTDTRLDFEGNPDGEPVIERLDPFKMVWDAAARKLNLTDARRLWYVDEKPLEEAKAMFPDVDPSELHAGWAKMGGDDSGPHDQVLSNHYGSDGEQSSPRKSCTIVECRWFEKEPFFRGPDLETGETREYKKEELDELLQSLPDFPHVRQMRKVVKRVFIGATVLGKPDRPLVPPGLLGWECVTGYRDEKESLFYGVVRPTKDPQRWANKYFSQVMYLLNSQSKGGIMAERGAFEDQRQAEESWTKADSITWVNNGALAANRVGPKPVAQFPAGFFTLFNESKEAISTVTGLSPEFVGTREVNQPGVLEAQRRQSSLNLLAPLFDSLRRYRKRQGKIVLFLIQNHLSDGRLIRIVGEDKAQYVPLTKEAVANIEYDIIVDDAPTSPNEKERTFAIVQQMLPILKDYVTPEIGLEILRYSPLPASLVDKLAQQAKAAQEEQAAQPQQPSPEQQMQEAKLQGIQADLQARQARNQMDMQSKGIDLYMKQQNAQVEMDLAAFKSQLEQDRLVSREIENGIRQQRANTQRARVEM